MEIDMLIKTSKEHLEKAQLAHNAADNEGCSREMSNLRELLRDELETEPVQPPPKPDVPEAG